MQPFIKFSLQILTIYLTLYILKYICHRVSDNIYFKSILGNCMHVYSKIQINGLSMFIPSKKVHFVSYYLKPYIYKKIENSGTLLKIRKSSKLSDDNACMVFCSNTNILHCWLLSCKPTKSTIHHCMIVWNCFLQDVINFSLLIY